MKNKLLIIILFLAVFSRQKGSAQQNDLYFDKLDIKSGLPESYVTDMLEDKQGYLWMSTQNGIARYDGYTCKVYKLDFDKASPIAVTNIRDLYLDKDNTVWATTMISGVFKYNRATDSFVRFGYKTNDEVMVYRITADDKTHLWGIGQGDKNRIFAWKMEKSTGATRFFGRDAKVNNHLTVTPNDVFITNAGSTWVATNNGLYKYNGKNKPFTGYFVSKDTLNSNFVATATTAVSEPDGMWLTLHTGNSNRLVSFNTKTGGFKEVPLTGQAIATGNIFSIFEDKQKRLWLASVNGLTLYQADSKKITHYSHAALSDIVEGAEGYLWFTSNEGLVCFNPKTGLFNSYTTDATNEGAISSNRISVKILDHTGSLWVGTAFFGVNKVNKKKSAITVYKQEKDRPGSYPAGSGKFTMTKNGQGWLINPSGLYKWLGGNNFKKVLSPKKGEEFLAGNSSCADSQNNLYIPVEGALLYYNTANGSVTYFDFSGVLGKKTSGLYAFGLYEDHEGIIWMSLNGQEGNGLASFNPATKQFKAYPYKKTRDKKSAENAGALDDERVLSIYEDRQNTLWVGTNWGGVNSLDRKTGKFSSSYPKNKNMICVTGMYEDTKGRFWVITYLKGLFLYDREKGRVIKNISEKSGLLFDSALSINEDANGQLWIASERGLSRVDPVTFKVKNFPVAAILSQNQIAPNIRQINLGDGRMVMELMNGMALFNPEDLSNDTHVPKVALEKIIFSNAYSKEKGQTVIIGSRKKLELAYNQNRIQFDYTGLHFDSPLENTYAYKLEGYDSGWVQAGTQRSTTYTNLPSGTYTFYIKAANSDGIWSKPLKGITITISAPWYNTWWAYIIYAVIFAVALRLYVLYRSRSLRKKNAELEQKVSLRTGELEHSLSELKQTQNQLIQSEKMASLGELTAGIAHEIQNPLNFVNNFSDVSIELLDEMEEELDKGDTDEAKAIANDIKQNLEKIAHHGRRADGIVKGMLQHSRASNGQKEPIDINTLADEYLRLAYHGMRAKDKSFNAGLVTSFAEGLPKPNVIPQDIGRVLLNLFTNAFYATQQKSKQVPDGSYKPAVEVITRLKGNAVEIVVKDNGTGMPDALKDKILQPFFTTKPTGEGTGLGLSLSYDIIVKGHGGTIDIESKEGEGSEFIITVPIK